MGKVRPHVACWLVKVLVFDVRFEDVFLCLACHMLP